MGNPFQESTNDRLVLDTQNIMLPSFVETVKTPESVRQNQYREFYAKQASTALQSSLEIKVKRETPCCFTKAECVTVLSTVCVLSSL